MEVDMDAWSKARIKRFLSRGELLLPSMFTTEDIETLLLNFENFLGECEAKRMRD
jgi:hypothetical protein